MLLEVVANMYANSFARVRMDAAWLVPVREVVLLLESFAKPFVLRRVQREVIQLCSDGGPR